MVMTIAPTLNEQQSTEGFVPHAPFAPAISRDDAVEQGRLLKVLGDSTRLQMLSLLARHGGTISVEEIVQCFALEQPTISHHMRLLRDAGLVDCQKRGLNAYYFIRPKAQEKVQQAIETITTLFSLSPVF